MGEWTGKTASKQTNVPTACQAITSTELTKKIINKKSLFILDVRNSNDYSKWKIEGEGIEMINVPYYDMLDGVDSILGELPKDQEIIVVCAKEGSSIVLADMLAQKGVTNLYYLKGGMIAWSEHLEPVKIGDLQNGGEIFQFIRIGKGCLSYYVESAKESVVIDPIRTTKVFEQFAKQRGAKIVATIDTHLHADHISGGRMLAERTGAAYYIPERDASEITFAYHKLEEGDDITIGCSKVEPISSPGHTSGSTSLIIDGQFLMTGDSLFIESIGRPDLAGKAEELAGDLRTTLYQRYQQLSGEMIVLPAHFGTISELGKRGEVAKRLEDLFTWNTGLNIQDEQEFQKIVTENLPPQPNHYQEIRLINQGKITPSFDEQIEMEIGPNRCAVAGPENI
ncbi:MBL fold metallo-hydrolase [Bacillus sp. WMMC1349]|uniref:MBL fold metallo-hydrolase n=1 Tax=Bacillus sp. WMMC1349 TaxID=2736254 RepID=UPI0020A6A752|nr:MBL fold metallo-hydrolase [Bacillus sp. WMMC1349]